jgi:hypothetical protein
MQQRFQHLQDLQEQINENVKSERDSIERAVGCVPSLDELGYKLSRHADSCLEREQSASRIVKSSEAEIVALRVRRDQLHDEIRDITKSLDAARADLSGLEATQTLVDARNRGASLQVAIDEVEEELKEELKLKLAIQNMGDLVGGYCKTARAKACCPLCDRPFQVRLQVRAFFANRGLGPSCDCSSPKSTRAAFSYDRRISNARRLMKVLLEGWKGADRQISMNIIYWLRGSKNEIEISWRLI